MTIKTRLAAAAIVALIVPLTGGCDLLGERPSAQGQAADAEADVLASIAADPYETHSKISEVRSAFTRDGTFETHTAAEGIDFVLTVYPTKATPRTHEWYPLGNKYFTFTFQAYDIDKALRDPFKTKRKSYLSRVEVTSTSNSAAAIGSTPFSLNANPLDITLDPTPLRSRKYGQMITSPKGSLEVRNQVIGDLPEDTTEVTLNFKFHVWVQKKVGAPGYSKQIVEEQMPLFIYKSDRPTRVLPIAIDVN